MPTKPKKLAKPKKPAKPVKPVKPVKFEDTSKSPLKVISVDIGRSSVKASWSLNKSLRGTLEFPFVVANSKKFLSQNTTSFSMEKETFEMTLYKDRFIPQNYLFGDSATLHGKNPKSDFSETQVFHEYAVTAILFCVGKILSKKEFSTKNKSHNIILSINLTYENIQSSNFYSEQIKKTHKLSIVEFGEEIPVEFTVKELYCFQQGYASIFNFLGEKNEKEVFSGTGLCIDIGRHSIDISIVTNSSLVNGASLPIGTHQLIEIIKRDAKKKGLSLSSSDIEATFKDPKKVFHSLTSKPYTPYATFKENAPTYFKMVVEELLSFVGDNSLTWILVVGGFTPYLKKALSQSFSSIPYYAVKDPRFANCLGMIKFLENI